MGFNQNSTFGFGNGSTGGGGGGVTAANDGLSLVGSTVKLGQTAVPTAGTGIAQLTEDRYIPTNGGNAVFFIDADNTTGQVAVAITGGAIVLTGDSSQTPATILMQDTGTSQIWQITMIPTGFVMNGGGALFTQFNAGNRTAIGTTSDDTLHVLQVAGNLGITYTASSTDSPALDMHVNWSAGTKTLIFGNVVDSGANAASNLLNLQLGGANKFTVRKDGFTGIAGASITAALSLPAGTAAASTAPLKFISGPILTAAEAGAMEYNGDLFITAGTIRYQLTPAIRSVSGNTSVTALDGTIVVDSSGGAIAITYDPTIGKQVVNIKKLGTDTNTITITASSGSIVADTGTGTTTYAFNSAGRNVQLQSNLTNIFVL